MTNLPKRKSLRLKGYDYSTEGFYYLTICTENRKLLLSKILTDEQDMAYVELTEFGLIADSYLKTFPGIDQYVIMPNHIHLIAWKTNGKNIANDVRTFKNLVTKKIGQSIWQTSYYDHIIRDEKDYLIRVKYIEDNPARWKEDEYAQGLQPTSLMNTSRP